MEGSRRERKRVRKDKPSDVDAAKALDEIGQVLIEKGITLEKWVEQGREIRGGLIEKDYGLSDREKRKKNQNRKELFDLIRKIQKRNKDVDPDEAMRIALEAQEVVRSSK